MIDPVTIGGMDGLAQAQLTVPAGVDVPLVVNFDATYNINWADVVRPRCTTFDLAMAHLRVEPADSARRHAGDRGPRHARRGRLAPVADHGAVMRNGRANAFAAVRTTAACACD